MTDEPRTDRIVIVDDTPDLRLLLRIGLQSHPGFDVVGEAGDGAAGLELVREHQPDAVLLDLAMAVMDGLEAVPRIRAASPATRIVVLSAFERGRMAETVLKAGAHAYVQKGATTDQIIAAIVQAIRPDAGQATSGSDGYDHVSQAAEVAPPADAVAELRSELDSLQDALATAAHELRSPATILSGLAQTLTRRRDQLDPATVAQLLDAVVRQTQVLDRVTADLLTSSQTQRDAVAVFVQPMPLRPALESAGVSTGEAADLSVEAPDDVWVTADRVRVDQMLGNLLSNAAKYGRPPIKISSECSHSHANVRVEDSGPGVPAEFAPRLFQQYARANGLRAGGNGLGLYVVKKLASAQGGDAWYEPRRGGGASFAFSLPLVGGGGSQEATEEHSVRR